MFGHRFLSTGAICVALAAVSHGASGASGASGAAAAGPKALDASYFFGPNASDLIHNAVTIVGQTFHGTEITMFVDCCGATPPQHFAQRPQGDKL